MRGSDSSAAVAESKLTLALASVFESPHARDSSVTQREEVDLVDRFEPALGRSLASPLAELRRGALEPARDPVPFSDELDDLHIHVRKGAPKWLDPRSRACGFIGHEELVDQLEPPAGDHVLDHSPDDPLRVQRSTPSART